LSGGSNLVVADEGCPELVIAVGLRGRRVEERAGRVYLRAAAGEPWDALVAWTVEQGWAGLECLSGIPGLVGATPIQNVGAYGQDVSETIHEVQVMSREDGALSTLSAEECRFSYRDSVFKGAWSGRYVVTEVTFALIAGGKPCLRYPQLLRDVREPERLGLADVRERVLALRAEKSMVFAPSDPHSHSCGSFFVNPVLTPAQQPLLEPLREQGATLWPQPDGSTKVPAAWLIEAAGMKRGTRRGAVGLSPHHALALVAYEGATSREVVALAHEIRSKVHSRFGIVLIPEPHFWGFGPLQHGLPEQ